jgi:hypothetical protein
LLFLPLNVNALPSFMATNLMSSTHGAVEGAMKNTTGGMKPRLLAAGAHLLISIAVASCVGCLVYLGWYPGPLDSISGIGNILLMLLSIDVTLGPLLTLIVFDRRKKSLRFDLSCIAVMQIAALAYGLYTVEAGRPHYLVFVKDRFEVVSRVDLQPADRVAAADNRAADVDWLGPRVVAADMPTSEQERQDLLFESALGGRDVHHFPKQYREYTTQAARASERAMPLSDLRAINPDADRVLQGAIARSGVHEDRLKFLPIKGLRGDATMLIDALVGAPAGMVALQPWR